MPVRAQLMDSWIWQPGLPADLRPPRRHRRWCSSQQRFALRRHRRRHGVRRADPPVDRRRRIARCCSSGASARAAADRPTQPSSSTPAATGSCASPTTTRCAPGSPATTLGELDRRSSATTSSTTRGTRWSPAAWRRPTSSTSSKASATSATSPCGRRSRIGLRGLGRLLDGDAVRRAARRASPTSSRPVVADLGWAAGDRRGRPHRQAPRPARRRCSPCRATTPTPRRAAGQMLDRRRRPTPSWSRPPPSAVAADRQRRRLRRLPATVPHRRRPRSDSCATSYALAEFPEPAADRADDRPGVVAARSRRRTLRSC